MVLLSMGLQFAAAPLFVAVMSGGLGKIPGPFGDEPAPPPQSLFSVI